MTRDALTYTLRALALPMDDGQAGLMAAYDRLAVFEDSADALARLKALAMPLAILSNADLPMLTAIVSHAGLDGIFEHLLSVDEVACFKTAPEAYALGPTTFGCAAEEILFVSSNGWDACGATWYGCTSFWINRADLPLELLDVERNGVAARCATYSPSSNRTRRGFVRRWFRTNRHRIVWAVRPPAGRSATEEAHLKHDASDVPLRDRPRMISTARPDGRRLPSFHQRSFHE